MSISSTTGNAFIRTYDVSIREIVASKGEHVARVWLIGCSPWLDEEAQRGRQYGEQGIPEGVGNTPACAGKTPPPIGHAT